MPPFPTKEEGPTETTLRVASPVLDKSEPAEKKVDSPAGQSEKRAQADSPVPDPKSPETLVSPGVGPPLIQPSEDDDVFKDKVPAPHVSPNPIAQKIANTLKAPTGYKGFAPRADRVSQQPTAANAQGLYPPDALIFVANLSNQRSEDQLEVACHQAFDTFGTCHVKVRLDKNGHPFAFLQFEKAQDAEAAMGGAVNLIIDGRKIRVERAKAERAVMLTKTDGGVVTTPEARRILDRYGPIEMCVVTTAATRIPYAACGVYVKFAYYLDCRDALRLFTNHAHGYALHLAPSLEPRFRVTPSGTTVIRGFSTPRSAVDQKSVYVGNLPDTATKEDVWGLFEEYGSIIDANVITRKFDNDGKNVFAFVEFSNPQEAEAAATAERWLGGKKLRIEPKEYSARRPHRAAFSRPQSSHGHQSTPQHFGQTRYPAHTNYGTPEMYPPGMTQMTPPPTSYGTNMGMQVFNPHHAPPAFATPPSHSMNRVMPMNMFSPTPPHTMNPYAVAPSQGSMYGGYSMGPIQESGEEENY